MRYAYAFTMAALIAATGTASADCSPGPMKQNEPAYTGALLNRLRSLGVTDIKRAQRSGEQDIYLVSGGDFGLFLTPDHDDMREIAFVLPQPSSPAETEKVITGAAFTLSRLSGTAEADIKARLDADLKAHSSGVWSEKHGSAAVVFKRDGQSVVARIISLKCNS